MEAMRNEVKLTYDDAALSLQGTRWWTHAIGDQMDVPDIFIVLCSSA